MKLLRAIGITTLTCSVYAVDKIGTVSIGGVKWQYSELNEATHTVSLGYTENKYGYQETPTALPDDDAVSTDDIPWSITFDGDSTPYTVTKIFGSAFYNSKLKGVLRIPNTVTTLGNYAFRNCEGLTGVASFGGIASMPDYAFDGCKNLQGPLPSFATLTTSAGNNAPFKDCSLSGVCVNGNVKVRPYAIFKGNTEFKILLFGPSTSKTGSAGTGDNAMLAGVTGCKVVMPQAGWNGVDVGGTSNKSVYYGPDENFDLSIDEGFRAVTAVPANGSGLVEILECAPLFKEHLGLNTRVNITNTLEIAAGTITAEMLNSVEFNSLQLTFKVNTQAQLDSVLAACPVSSYPLLAIDSSDAREELTLPQGREIFIRVSSEGRQGKYTPKINGLIIKFY